MPRIPLIIKLNQYSVEYDQDIRKIANWLANGDKFLAEELRSEMHIAILTLDAEKSKAVCIRTAKCKAIDYLRSKSRHYSYDGYRRHVSLDAMQQAGFQIDTDGNVYAPHMDETMQMENFDDEQTDSSDQ